LSKIGENAVTLSFPCLSAALEVGPKYLSINITGHKGRSNRMRTTVFH